MEWVETTGRTVEEAKDAALDQLGVDEQDAEFEIVEEPKFGLFGRLRAEARVRARVRPTTPRPKDDRRDRRKRKPKAGTDEAAGVEPENSSDSPDVVEVAASRSQGRASSATKAAAAPRRSPRRPPTNKDEGAGGERGRAPGRRRFALMTTAGTEGSG